jgi:hypothetical protein
MKYIKTSYKAFSTVEAIVSAVLLTVVMMLVYSALSSTMDHDRTLTITRGIAKVESWRVNADSLMQQNDFDPLLFEGGKVILTPEETHSSECMRIHFEIQDQSGKTVIAWNEMHLRP